MKIRVRVQASNDPKCALGTSAARPCSRATTASAATACSSSSRAPARPRPPLSRNRSTTRFHRCRPDAPAGRGPGSRRSDLRLVACRGPRAVLCAGSRPPGRGAPQELVSVPFFDGLIRETICWSVPSPRARAARPSTRARQGCGASARLCPDASSWLKEHNVSVEDVERVITERRGFEEVVLRLDGQSGPIALPIAVVPTKARRADRRAAGLLQHLGAPRPPRPPATAAAARPQLREADVVGDYQHALAAGDVEAMVAAFERTATPASRRRPARPRGAMACLASMSCLFSNGGGIPLEHRTVIDDGRSCALEYNLVRWGETELAPQAGVAVCARFGREACRSPHLRRRRSSSRPQRVRSARHRWLGADGL